MITYKQLSLADIFTACQNKLSRCLSFLILTLPPADLVNIFFIRCSRPCYYSSFSLFQDISLDRISQILLLLHLLQIFFRDLGISIHKTWHRRNRMIRKEHNLLVGLPHDLINNRRIRERRRVDLPDPVSVVKLQPLCFLSQFL